VSFWRWPGSLNAANCSRLAAHIDVLPTLAAIAGAKIPATAKPDGRSLLPLLINPNDAWADRYLFTHVGRWAKGQAAQSKYEKCAVRTLRWRLVNNNELYDIANDRGENHNMLEQHPDVAADLRKAYDRWWEEILPCLENEETIGPKVNPFKELYWKQYGGPGPNNVGPDDPAAKPLP
jgi:arylsulfatase